MLLLAGAIALSAFKNTWRLALADASGVGRILAGVCLATWHTAYYYVVGMSSKFPTRRYSQFSPC